MGAYHCDREGPAETDAVMGDGDIDGYERHNGKRPYSCRNDYKILQQDGGLIMGQANKNRTRDLQLQIGSRLLFHNIKKDLETQMARRQDGKLLDLLKSGVVAEVKSEKEAEKLLV